MSMKEKILLQRNTEGKLLPVNVDIEEVGECKIMPLTRGDVQELIAKKTSLKEEDADLQIAKKCLAEPQLTEEEWKSVKYDFINILVQKIFEISGVAKSKKNKALEEVDELKN